MLSTPTASATDADLTEAVYTLDNAISRVTGLQDHAGSAAGTVLDAYMYLGLGTIVQQTQGNGVDLSYIQENGGSSYNTDAGDQYTGLDRFGRIIDQNWSPISAVASPTDRFQNGYDRSSNVLDKNNLVSSSNSELYHANSSSSGDNNTAYDSLNRLGNFRRERRVNA